MLPWNPQRKFFIIAVLISCEGADLGVLLKAGMSPFVRVLFWTSWHVRYVVKGALHGALRGAQPRCSLYDRRVLCSLLPRFAICLLFLFLVCMYSQVHVGLQFCIYNNHPEL